MTRRQFVPLVAGAAARTLYSEPNDLHSLTTGRGRIVFDSAGRIRSFRHAQTELANPHFATHALHILYPGKGINICDSPVSSRVEGGKICVDHQFTDPYTLSLRCETELLDIGNTAVAIKQRIVLKAEKPIRNRVVVQLPCTFQLPVQTRQVFLPMKFGVGRKKLIRGFDNEDNYVYELAGTCAMGRNQLLAIPMVHEFSDKTQLRLTHVADPLFTSLLRLPFGDYVGQWQWIYPESPGLPATEQERTFHSIAHFGSPDQAIDLFYQTALADVKPGPSWLHDIALIDYDYLSKNGQGWFADIETLTRAVTKKDRAKVALVLHGWYDVLGSYTYDPRSQALAKNWTAFPSARSPQVQTLGLDPDERGIPSMLLTPGYKWNRKAVEVLQPVPFSLNEMHRRIRFAKDRGFRVFIYFADGLNACDDLKAIYSPEKVLLQGGWQGPDTTGRTYVQNPLHPEVRSFYKGYVQALLAEYGPEIDGFVWDETNVVAADSPGSVSMPGYAGRAMMTLVKEIASAVASHPQLAFLTSDCIGNFNETRGAPYALMAHGTYQDTHCRPEAWPYALFPNYRNTFWSCNWASVSNFDFMKFGVEAFDTPVSIGNGSFGDDIGISDMTAAQAQAIVNMFESRKQREMHVRWIDENEPSGRYAERALRNPYNIL